MKSILYFSAFFLMSALSTRAQQWVEMMNDPDVNFYDVQSEFNKYFSGKTRQRGDGWKPFKRWEYFMEPRVFPTGERPDPGQVWKEMMRYKSQRSQQSGNQLQGPANWQPMGPTSWTNTSGWNPGLGRINGITVDPVDTSIIYIGAPAGGCWKSTDYGQTWTCLTDTLPILGVSSIAVDYTNHNTIYIATGDGDAVDTRSIGVLKSTDGGLTWNTTGLVWTIYQYRRIFKLLMHPANPDIIYAATNNGIWKTTDAGVTWNNMFSGGFYDIEFKPGDPATLYISSDQFYKSTDSGNSWTQI
ncbi:MAG: WD40/YVTN/BNR-like repeat-containing protein, partial [Flavobacteriales bacterium]